MRALALHATVDELRPLLLRCEGADWAFVDQPAALANHRPEVVLSIKSNGMPASVHRPALLADGVRWFHVGGSGIEHLGRWDPARTTVTSCTGVLAPFLGERALAALLHLTTGHQALEQQQRTRTWAPSRFVPLAGCGRAHESEV